ncbi:MAG: FixH family protein [Cellvibrionaceae bacterium]|nr:FixH family protein [Cellvibrionaceae bacterium]MCV6627458.1 FixH family protein [Cellvibrionaceae bacterium]
MPAPIEDTVPWYKQFYPWMLIALPGTVVIACIYTIYLAINADDSVVSDTYYKDGLKINQRLEQDHRAKELGLEAQVQFDLEVGDIVLEITGLNPDPEQLQLEILHPTNHEYDRKVVLHQLQGNKYRGDLENNLTFRQYLRLSPVGDINEVEWRLNGDINFRENSSAKLGGQ